MTVKQKKYLRVLLWSHGIGLASVPVFLLLAYVTRSWGFFRLGECYYRLFLRLYCPGCGGTRAIGALVRFDISEAFTYCPALFVVIAAVIWMDFWIFLSLITRREKLLRLSTPHILWGVLAVVVIIAVIRNILVYTVGYDPLGDLTAMMAGK